MDGFRNQPGGIREQEVTVDQVAEALQRQSHTLVDVRELDEWHEVHIDGVVHMPLTELTARAAELPEGKPVHTVCHVGVRSLYAVQILERLGHAGAKSLAGGMDAWVAAHKPVVR